MDPVTQVRDRFVLHWGEMARLWGISKTMGQVHALLYITGTQWTAEDIMEQLQISRGNVSMTLKELQAWGLVGRSHHLGERKEYYQAERDVWEIFHRVAAERKRRELDPTHVALKECVDLLRDAPDSPQTQETRERIERLREFMGAIEQLYQQFLPATSALRTPPGPNAAVEAPKPEA